MCARAVVLVLVGGGWWWWLLLLEVGGGGAFHRLMVGASAFCRLLYLYLYLCLVGGGGAFHRLMLGARAFCRRYLTSVPFSWQHEQAPKSFPSRSAAAHLRLNDCR